MSTPSIKYHDFLRLREQNKVYMSIGMSHALTLIKYLPRNDQVVLTVWSFLLVSSVPGFLAVSIFVKWWVGLLLLFFVTPAIFKSIKQTAAQFVLYHAESNEDFFQVLADEGIVRFELRP